jgi:2-phosphinomethylmalic acid synthase
MCAFTGASGAVRQAEFFVYHAGDRAMLEGASNAGTGGAPVEPTTWIRATRKDADLVRSLGVRETGMLASASDYHTFHKFTPGGRSPAARAYLDAVDAVLDAVCAPASTSRTPPAPRASSCCRSCRPRSTSPRPTARTSGPGFRVCDTMGLGLPSDNVAWPRSVPGMVRELRALGLRAEDLEFHPHNDTHLVVANSLAAVMAGCAAVNGTLLGKGERTGNARWKACCCTSSG